jgi:hypothetical protein
MPTWQALVDLQPLLVQSIPGWIAESSLTVLIVSGQESRWYSNNIDLPFDGIDLNTGRIRQGFTVSGSWMLPWTGSVYLFHPASTGQLTVGSVWSSTVDLGKLTVSGRIPAWGWNGATFLPIHAISGFLYTGVIFTSSSLEIPVPGIRTRGTGYTIPKFSDGDTDIPSPSILGYFRVNPLEPLRKAVVMNVSHGGVSEYPNFPFNSFGYFNGIYFGANSSGIFRLDAASDSGTFINAEVRIPLQDLRIPHPKHLREAWLTFRSDGDIALVIQVEEDTVWTNTVTFLKKKLHEQRAKIARGLSGRFIAAGIRNIDGSDFDLDTMRVVVDFCREKVR